MIQMFASFEFQVLGLGLQHSALHTLPGIQDSGLRSCYLTIGELCKEIENLHDIHFVSFKF